MPKKIYESDYRHPKVHGAGSGLDLTVPWGRATIRYSRYHALELVEQ